MATARKTTTANTRKTGKPSPHRSLLWIGKTAIDELSEDSYTFGVQLMQAGIGNNQVCELLRKQKHIKEDETLSESLLKRLRDTAFPATNTRRRPQLSAEAYHAGMLGMNRMLVRFVQLMDACFDALLTPEGTLKPIGEKRIGQLRSLLALSTQRIREIMTPESELIVNFLDTELARIQQVTQDKTLSEERKKQLIAQFQQNMAKIVVRIADSIREGKPVTSLEDLAPDIKRFFMNKEAKVEEAPAAASGPD